MAGYDDDKIRERAYSIWESEGRQDGRHDEHWQRAEAELNGDASEISQSIPDRDTINREPAASEDGLENDDEPPARSGQRAATEAPVEASGNSNPTHHDGHLPSDPLTK